MQCVEAGLSSPWLASLRADVKVMVIWFTEFELPCVIIIMYNIIAQWLEQTSCTTSYGVICRCQR